MADLINSLKSTTLKVMTHLTPVLKVSPASLRVCELRVCVTRVTHRSPSSRRPES